VFTRCVPPYTPGGVVVVSKGGAVSEEYGDVIFACHSDQALALLGPGASTAENSALGAIKYQANEVYLHSDVSFMPRTRAAWASWNCLKGSRGTTGDDKSVCVSYWVNLLQNLPAGTPDLFVTLNPPTPPAPHTVQRQFTMSHPLFNQAAIEAQRVIADTQGAGGVWFCGAWCGYGFHEDGIRSAVTVADLMLGKSSVPWNPRPCNPHLNLTTRIALPLFARVGASWVPPGRCFKMILPNGAELDMKGKKTPAGAPLGVGVDGRPVPAEVRVQVFDQRMFLQAVLRADIGLGESYMNGDFDCDLYALLDMLCAGHPANTGASTGADNGVPFLGYDLVGALGNVLHWLGAKMEFAAHAALSNTKEGSKKNIEYHYDAGNAFYKLFLDETMLYSSGIHQPLSLGPCTVASALGHIAEDDFAAREAHLEAAQYAKIDAMIARLDLRVGEHVLEIGCGWGTCAMRIATQVPGVKVTGITISNEQFAEARARVKAAGLEDFVDIVMCDYRDVVDVYDKVISIEMLEAVGHEHLPTFFSTVSRALKPGGKAAIQVITMPDDRYESYCKSESDFIRAYIFPGGHLPSVGAMKGAANPVGLRLAGYDDIGEHYAVTLRLWRERMMARADTVLGLGYSRKFLRMFEFYFAYCEAGFAHRLIYDLQMTWVKEEGAMLAGSQSCQPQGEKSGSRREPVEIEPSRGAKVVKRSNAKGSSDAPVDVTWAAAGAILCFWIAATLLAAASRPHMLAIPVVVAAAFTAQCFAVVAVAAVLAVAFDDRKSKVRLAGDATSQSLMFRATRLATPAVSATLSLGLGSAAAAYVVSETANVFRRAGTVSNLAELLLAVETPARSNETAVILVAIAAALALRRLISVFFAAAAATPGVTSSAHDTHVARDTAIAAMCFTAMYTDTFMCALAAASVAHVHAAAVGFQELARVGAGFPHGDSSAHRASRALSLVTFVCFRAAPHVLALVATAPRAMTAAVAVTPVVGNAVIAGGRAVIAAAMGVGVSGSGAGALAMAVGAAAAAASDAGWVAAAAVAIAATPAVPAVCACIVAVAANLSNLAALAQTIQERRAEAAVRSRIIKLATSAEV